jgi:nucleotide-binding universal stress UspA family protein
MLPGKTPHGKDEAMPIRKLLVPLTGTAAGEAAIATALCLARKFNAHIYAIHVRADSRDVAPLAGEGLSGAMIQEMMQATDRESNERSSAIRTMFDNAIEAAGIHIEKPAALHDHPTATFAVITGREEDVVAHQARLADYTIVPHPESGDDVSSSDALHAVLFDSGRAVMIAPHHAPQTLGRRVAVAWNGSGESAAAVQAAMPLLHRADAVRILMSDEYQRNGPPARELAAYLAMHGVQAEIATFRSIDREVGAGMLAAARDFGADLMTMGAYSHSRLRQLILGGVTRHVLEHADLPVLMNR